MNNRSRRNQQSRLSSFPKLCNRHVPQSIASTKLQKTQSQCQNFVIVAKGIVVAVMGATSVIIQSYLLMVEVSGKITLLQYLRFFKLFISERKQTERLRTCDASRQLLIYLGDTFIFHAVYPLPI